MEPQTGQLINNKYRLVRLIGDGGMGSVFEARHELLGTTVALKFLHTALSRRKGLVERFLQEAQVSARIKSPHVVHVQDVDRTSEGLAYMVMEYVEGTTLQELYEQLYRQGKRLTYGDAFRLMFQLLEGVGAAHKMDIVHRDLKPDNVMLAHDGSGATLIKILDFGIAKLRASGEMDRGLTRPGVVMGTPEYMAPEQAFSADKVDARADIFSLGVMFYEMLAGRRPVGGENAMAIAAQYLEGNITQLRTLVPTIAAALGRAVHRAMASRPEGRFSSVAEFRSALLPFAPEGPTRSHGDATPPANDPYPAPAAAAGTSRQEQAAHVQLERRVPKTLPGDDDETKADRSPDAPGASGVLRRSGVPLEPSEAIAPEPPGEAEAPDTAPDGTPAPEDEISGSGRADAGAAAEDLTAARPSAALPSDAAEGSPSEDEPTSDLSASDVLRLQAPSSAAAVGQAGTAALPPLGPSQPRAEPEIEIKVLGDEHAAEAYGAAPGAAETARADAAAIGGSAPAAQREAGAETSEATPFGRLAASPVPAGSAEGEPRPMAMAKGSTAAEPALVLKGATAAVPDRPGGTVVASPYGAGGFQAAASTPMAADALLGGFGPSPVPPAVGALTPGGPGLAAHAPFVAAGRAGRRGSVGSGPSLLSILLLAGGVAGAVVGGVFLANEYGPRDESPGTDHPTRTAPATSATTTQGTTTTTSTTELVTPPTPWPTPSPSPTPRPTQTGPGPQPTGKPTTTSTTTSTGPLIVIPTSFPTFTFPFPMPGPGPTATGPGPTTTATTTPTKTSTRPKIRLPAPMPKDG